MKSASRTSPPGAARLFSEPQHAAPPSGVYLANIDGASRGNPGPAAYAVIVRAPDGKVVLSLGKYLGRETNNVAEYHALLSALDYAENQGIRALRVRSDSELLVRQMQGRYKVKHPALRPLHERAAKMARALDYFAIEYIPREQNRDADRLANQALNRAEGGKTQTPNSAPLRARAHYVNGVLVPFEPLDLPEGTEVDVTLRKVSER